MSQYVNFFIKTKDEKYIPIADYSRSSWAYKIMSDAPYEKLKRYSYTELENKIFKLQELITSSLDSIKRTEEQIQLVGQMNNSIDDKIKIIYDLHFDIIRDKECLEELEITKAEFNFIANLYSQDLEIYAGVEVGDSTIQEIMEK